jgi:hypothetical protein
VIAPKPIHAARPKALVTRDEIAVLQEASIAIAKRNFPGARRLLTECRARFPTGALSEERLGLELLLRCAEQPTATQADAERFMARFPQNVFGARIRHACQLEAP